MVGASKGADSTLAMWHLGEMTGRHDAQGERLAGLARDLRAQHKDAEATYRLAVQIAHDNVDASDGASMSIVRQRKVIETVAATSDLAGAADRLQYDLGEGPCLDEVWEHHTVYSPDLSHDKRWPTWGPRAVEETSAKSVVAFRVFTHEDELGVLNVYSRTADAFDAAAQEEGAAIAAHVAIAIAAAHEIGHLMNGLDSRAVIGQATGMLMGRFHLDPDSAFKVLARYSSTSQVKLREVAAEIVATGVMPHTGGTPRPRVTPPGPPTA